MHTKLDLDLSGTVSLAGWLVAMKANADRSPEATQKLLALYDLYLSGEKAAKSRRR